MAKKYYCHKCAKKRRRIEDPPTGKIIQTQYQDDKHRKHTQVDSTYPIQSVFSDSSTSVYASYIVKTMLKGIVEIDDRGRKNIIGFVGKDTGFRHEHGNRIRPTDAVKVVLSSATSSIHAFPENSTCFNAETCIECGDLIVF